MDKIQKVTTKDGTIMHLLNGKLHSWDQAAFIPQGNMKLAEYYLFGIKYSKKDWQQREKETNGIPFCKTAAGRAGGRM